MNASRAALDLPDSVSLVAGGGGLDMLRVASPLATAEVYLHGAHVGAWAPAGERPVIWMSKRSEFQAGKAIRGGIPVCFPWFGAGREPGMAPPPHGFARLATWRLVSATDDDGVVTLTLRLTRDDVVGIEAAKAWPHDFEATYTVRIGRELEIALTIRNTGDEEFSYEEALHTYLAVDDARSAQVRGLDGAHYLDKAPGAAPELQTQSGAVTFEGETDRVYTSDATAILEDVSGGRSIGAAKDGSAQTVVWNPWVDKAAAMPDFGDDEWTGMACVEAANALDEAITLAPGESHTLAVTYAVND